MLVNLSKNSIIVVGIIVEIVVYFYENQSHRKTKLLKQPNFWNFVFSPAPSCQIRNLLKKLQPTIVASDYWLIFVPEIAPLLFHPSQSILPVYISLTNRFPRLLISRYFPCRQCWAQSLLNQKAITFTDSYHKTYAHELFPVILFKTIFFSRKEKSLKMFQVRYVNK